MAVVVDNGACFEEAVVGTRPDVCGVMTTPVQRPCEFLNSGLNFVSQFIDLSVMATCII